MIAAMGLANASAVDVDEDQDAQDLLGRVRHRRQRIGRQHGEAGDAGETLVMGQMRRDRLADHESLDLADEFLLQACSGLERSHIPVARNSKKPQRAAALQPEVRFR